MFTKYLKVPEIRRRILFSLFVILVFRLLAHIPVPGVQQEAIKAFFSKSEIFSIFNMFSGGGFQNFSIVALGLSPYINASIIIQLFTTLVPSLEELSKEGEQGREILNNYTRLLTLPLALFNAYGLYIILRNQNVIDPLATTNLIVLILTLTAGTMILMWVGDLVTEYGIGQGISLLIFAGIVSALPRGLIQFLSTAGTMDPLTIAVIVLVGLALLVLVTVVNEGTRNIPIEYGRRSGTGIPSESYLPIKINQTGMIPIIFAVAIASIPSFIGPLLNASDVSILNQAGSVLTTYFAPTSWVYIIMYFLLVFGFTYFYTFFQFDPVKIADDVKKRGGFVSGVRPGKNTESYLRGIIVKLTFFGALFLGSVAILPSVLQKQFGISQSFVIGGASLLIVVSVVLEIIRQVQSLSVSRSYDKYL
jgi:preprotein translocase subunit SecY